MRFSRFSYHHIFRSTAIAALAVGVLPSYAQVVPGKPTPVSGTPGKSSIGKPGPASNALPAPVSGGGSTGGTGVTPITGNPGTGTGTPSKPTPTPTPVRPTPRKYTAADPARQRAQTAHRLALMRLSPNGKVNWSAYKTAAKQIARMPKTVLGRPQSSGGGHNGHVLQLPGAQKGGVLSSPVHRPNGAPPVGPDPASATWDLAGPIGMQTNGIYWSYVGAPALNPFGTGVFTGRVNSATFDPSDATGNTIYLATPGGGVFKSIDGGTTWTGVTDSNLPGNSSGSVPLGIAFSSVTVDSNNPNTIYAGSGDYDGTVTLGSGLYKSTDGGSTWTLLSGLPSGSNAIRKVVVDPKDTTGNHLYVALGRDQDVASIGLYADGTTFVPPFGQLAPNIPTGGIYSSNDGGVTWTQELDSGPGATFNQIPGYVSNITYNSNYSELYASVDFRGIYRKQEPDVSGYGWVPVAGINVGPLVQAGVVTGLQTPVTERVDVATSPNDPNTAYFLAEATRTLYVTNDGGNTTSQTFTSVADANAWDQSYFCFTLAVGSSVNGVGGVLSANAKGGGAKAFGGIGTLPPPPVGNSLNDIIYLGMHDVYKSTDGGQTFVDVSAAAPSTGTGIVPHSEQHRIVINPNNAQQFLVCNDGGVYLGAYDPVTDSVSFSNLNANLNVTEVFDFASHPTDPSTLLVANNNNAEFVATGDLTLWNQLFDGTGTKALINPVEPLTQYVLFKGPGDTSDVEWFSNSDDNWLPFTSGPLFTVAANPWPVQPAYPDVDTSYQALTPITLRTDTTAVTFAANPQYVYAAKHFLYLWDDTTRYTANTLTPDNYILPKVGKWTKEAELIPTDATLKNYYVNDFATVLVAHPTTTNTLYVGTAQGALYYSTSQGAAVTDIGSQLGVGGSFSLPKQMITGIAADPLNAKRIFVTIGGTGIGTSHIWRCDDITVKAPKWIRIDGGSSSTATQLPDIPITSIALLPRDDDKAIVVATELGLFYTANAGLDWTVVSTGAQGSGQALPSSIATKLEINASTGELNVNAYGRGVWRSLVGLNNPVNIQLTLTSYRGVKSNLTAKVDLFHAGQNAQDWPSGSFAPIISVTDGGKAAFTDYFGYNTTPVEQHNVTLTAAGAINTNVTGAGTYDFYVHIPGFLRKKVQGLNTTVPVNSAGTLIPGDVNDDNQITGADYNLVFAAAQTGLYTNPLVDVNGDGIVNNLDVVIVLSNINKKGD